MTGDARQRRRGPARGNEPPVDATPNYMTPAGHAKLSEELDFLHRLERPKVVREVQDAAAQGDRSENAEYIYGKRRLREIDRRLNFLARRLKYAQVVDPTIQRGERVFFGAHVTVADDGGVERTYQIVGEDEVAADEGRISWKSPLGRGMLKKSVGDTVVVLRPGGEKASFEITQVRYG